MTPAVGLADLARLLRALPAESHAEAAAMLGFRRAASEVVRVERRDVAPGGVGPAGEAAAPATVEGRAGFWRVEAAEERAPAVEARGPSTAHGLTERELQSEPGRPLPAGPPLTPWSRLEAPLRVALHTPRRGRAPDVPALVRTWARGEWVARIQRRARQSWAASVALWIDRSARLTPFWADQDLVRAQLVRLCGRAAIDVTIVDSAPDAAVAAVDRPVLVLGDLGFYGIAADRARWLRMAERLTRAGARIAALVPCPVGLWDRAAARAWQAMAWERLGAIDDRGTAEARAEALLRLVAPTALAQPGLLRALRHLLPAARADASTEVDVWRHADVQAADVTGLVLRREASRRWRARFAAEVPVEVQREVCALIDRWHGGWCTELMHAETIAWIGHGLADPPGKPDEALAYFGRVDATLNGEGGAGAELAMVKHFAGHALLPVPAKLIQKHPALLSALSAAVEGVDDAQLPSGIKRHDLVLRAREAPRRWAVHQRGEALVVVRVAPGLGDGAGDGDGDGTGYGHGGGAGYGDGSGSGYGMDETGSPVAMIAAARPEIWVGQVGAKRRTQLIAGAELALSLGGPITLSTDCGEVTLGVWERPTWAAAAGRDRHGLWAAFEVAGVRQRVRWIPPGRFLMGSPEGEAGRFDDEGPQHWVTITRGYWLGDAPVTQALWTAVMGENPSRFRSDDRPVEQVSWADSQGFLARLKRVLDGFAARLPTEAEWERACRAGTTTATWVSDLTLRGENDAPELDAIAWYGGNSGVGFDLANGYDASDWPEKQHPGDRSGTHPVGQKSPNPYGLHDMLGNVYEWCQDAAEGFGAPARYTSEPVEDPVAEERGSARVYRGGAWRSNARYVRAALRFADEPGYRSALLGFRLAGGQAAPSPSVGKPRRKKQPARSARKQRGG